MTNAINTLNPEFNTREEYIAYRDAWRSEYKELSKKIRQMKITVKEQQRAGAYADQTGLVRLRTKARQMMEARTLATTRMWEQRNSKVAA